MAALIGYARVSTTDQNMALQLDALTAAVCLRIFSDKLSATATHRPGLAAALSHLREGDTLIVWKLDRLGRTVRGLVELLAELDSRGVNFKSVTEGIDTTTTAGRMFFHLVAAFAQMERELIVERTQAGLATARARGRRGGRPRLISARKLELAKKMFASAITAPEIAQSLGVSVRTLYRCVPIEFRQIDAFPPEALPPQTTKAPNGHAGR